MFNGVIVYSGPSMIDGSPIVVIATGLQKSKNRKTGNMIQTYILRADIHPVQAVKENKDFSICGNCVHRGTGEGKSRTCYVSVFRSPAQIWNCYKRNGYASTFSWEIFKNKIIRFGSYGDPAAVPVQIWENFAKHCLAFTGYTHQWKNSSHLQKFCMASVDNDQDALYAQSLNWRTFRINFSGTKNKNEIVCPASAEQNHKLTCNECRACNGTATNRRGNVTIKPHGGLAVMSHFKRFALSTVDSVA